MVQAERPTVQAVFSSQGGSLPEHCTAARDVSRRHPRPPVLSPFCTHATWGIVLGKKNKPVFQILATAFHQTPKCFVQLLDVSLGGKSSREKEGILGKSDGIMLGGPKPQ